MGVVIYSTPTCGYCHQAKQYLSQKGVRFTEHDVSSDQSAAREMVRLTGQMGVPVIVFNEEVIVGFDRGRLDELLASYHPASDKISLGVSVADAIRVAPRYGLTPLPGALVGRVAPESPAQVAGLREGDVIQEINHQPVGDASSLQFIITGMPKGNLATIVFIRSGKRMAVEARV